MKTLFASWRDALVAIAAFAVVIFLFALLANPLVHENPLASNVVTGLLQIAMGGLKLVFACAFAWFALAMTFPEANKSIVGDSFDGWWRTLTLKQQCLTGLISAAILFIGACLCLAS